MRITSIDKLSRPLAILPHIPLSVFIRVHLWLISFFLSPGSPIGELSGLPTFMNIYKIIGRDAGLSDCTAEGAKGKLFVNGDYTTFILFAKYNVTAALADYDEAEFFENFDRL